MYPQTTHPSHLYGTREPLDIQSLPLITQPRLTEKLPNPSLVGGVSWTKTRAAWICKAPLFEVRRVHKEMWECSRRPTSATCAKIPKFPMGSGISHPEAGRFRWPRSVAFLRSQKSDRQSLGTRCEGEGHSFLPSPLMNRSGEVWRGRMSSSAL